MKLSQEAKSMIAMMALVLAIVLGLNLAVAPEADRSMVSWAVSLVAVAILFWIWIRRDAMAEGDGDAVEAADAAARQAEELARRTVVRHAVEPASETVAFVEANDLTLIIGIGPVFAKVLNEAGIMSYWQLAERSEEELEAIIEAAGRNRPGYLDSWPVQAGFAAAGDWEGLRKYLDSE